MLTTFGFIIKRIPILNEIPIGGRLSRCFDSWKLISKSEWVNRVISEGYKIPFKYVPVMKRLPTSPPFSGPAFEVLVSEAEALQLKHAIFLVSHVRVNIFRATFRFQNPALKNLDLF